MGMYTRLTFWADLSTESAALPAMKALMGDTEWESLPDHPFFQLPHARSILRCSSYYHRTGETQLVYDDIARAWWLNVDSSLKNYRGEIRGFLDWLSPCDIGDGGFRGFFLYEEDEHPTLIYREGDTYVERQVAP